MNCLRIKDLFISPLLFFVFSITTYSQVPRISGFSPLSGPTGTVVTISGNNFSADPQQNIVSFGSVRASVVSASPGTLTVKVPVGAGSLPLSVTTGRLTGVASSSFLTTFNGGYSFYDNSFPRIEPVIAAGKEINSIITADLDNDGLPDIVLPGGKSAAALHLTVLKNAGTGRNIAFNKQDISIGGVSGIAKEVAVGDLDGDGKQDLAVVLAGSSKLIVLRNTSVAGSVSFDAPVEVPLLSAVSWVGIGDFDADGKPDIALADQLSSVFIYTNSTVNTALSFARGPKIETCGLPVALLVADMDQDGLPDIITASASARGVCVNRNSTVNGILSFEVTKSISTEEIPFAIAIGDFEADGKLDLAVSIPSLNKVAAISNRSTPGNLQLNGAMKYPSGDQPKGIAITDLNGDGQADIITGNTGFGNISVIRNNTRSAGYFAFDMYRDYQANLSNPALISAWDYNADGQPDIAAASAGQLNVRFFRNATTEPTVKVFSPAVATMEETVTITGTNFFDITAVRFGGIAAASFTVESPTSIKAVLAEGATGSVEVQNANGVSALAGFTYSGLPVITSFSPASSERDRPVLITGKNFTDIVSVKFGNTDAGTYVVNSPSSITARPVAGSSGSITIVTKYGTATKEGFVFLKTPVITDNAPYKAKAGTTITVRGNNFSDRIEDNIVQFGSLKGIVTAASSTAISVTVPNGAPYAPVTVTSKQHTVYSKQNLQPVFPDGDLPFSEKFFLPVQQLSSILNARTSVTADIDGDGKMDLLNAGNGMSSIFLNKSTENTIAFEKAWELPADINILGTGAIAAGDINADGRPDIVVNAPTLKVLVNTSSAGSISFAPPVDIYNRACARMSIVDLDDDGRPEIVAAIGSNAEGIKVFRNIGNPATILFELATQLPNDDGYALNDIDLDGKPDFILRNGGSQDISVIRNNSTPGTITFESPRILLTPGYPLAVAVADMNEDGRKDVVVAIANTTTYCVFHNQSGTGALVFNTRVNYQAEKNLANIELADLNGDGKADIVLSYRDEKYISIVKNTTTIGSGQIPPPQFGERADYEVGVKATGLLIADWNNDNQFDLMATTEEGKVVVLRNNLFRPLITSFSPTEVMPGKTVTIKGYNFKEANAVHFGAKPAVSFNIVSANEIQAVVGEGNEGTLTVTNPWLTNGKDTVTFPKPVITGFAPAAGAAGTVVTITGKNFNILPSSNAVYFGAVRATIISASENSLQVRVPVSSSYQLLSVTTFGVTGWSSKPFNVTYGVMGQEFTASSFGDSINHIINPVSNINGVASGDFNNDGLPDLAVTDLRSKQLSILVNASTPGSIKFDAPLVFNDVTDPNRVLVEDINGDGKLDVVVVNELYGNLYVYRNTSAGNAVSFSLAPAVNVCARIKGISAGDLDGDGKADLVAFNDQSYCIYKNTSRGDNVSFKSTLNPLSVIDALIMDLDGDNKPELIYTRDLTNAVTILKNISQPGKIEFGTLSYIPLSINNHGLNLVGADFDGDNKPDLAVLEGFQIAGQLSCFRNTSNAGIISFTAAGKFSVEYGHPWSLKVSDMDGDGKPDIIGSKGGVATTRAIVYKNNSTEAGISFKSGVVYRPNYNCTDLSITDIDGDGRQDIITAYPGDSNEPGAVTILRNKIGEPRIAPNGSNPVTGNVITRLYIDPSVQSLNGHPYVQRHADLNPVKDPQTATARITMFFTQQEFDNFNAAANHGPDLPKSPDDATGKSNLRVYQYHGTSNSGIPGTYSGNGLEIDPADADIVWNTTQQYWEVTFAVNGFSGFFVSSKGFMFNQTPAPVISADFASFCQNGHVVLHSSADKNNQWYKEGVIIASATGKTYTANTSGNYTVTATNNNIVSPASSVFRVTAGETPSKPVISRTGLVLSSNSNTGNQWFKDGVLLQGATNKEITPVNGSKYAVQVTINGCVSPMSDDYYFVVTGVIDIDDQQYIRLSPNPVKSDVVMDFRLNNIPMLNITIADMSGRIVLQQNRKTSGSRVNLAHLTRGVYFVRITSDNRKVSYTMKIMKQ